jgi:hypothetical protein
MSIRTLVILITLPMILGLQPVRAADAATDATADGQAFLELIDHGQYAASWTKTGVMFKAKLNADSWAQMAKSARASFGALVQRKPGSASLTKSLPGAPDGEYAVIRYQTGFEKKAEAVETVTLTHEADHWAVIGYFIR